MTTHMIEEISVQSRVHKHFIKASFKILSENALTIHCPLTAIMPSTYSIIVQHMGTYKHEHNKIIYTHILVHTHTRVCMDTHAHTYIPRPTLHVHTQG